nr:AlNc14C303G10405 [Albugo laibachii Nc14]|eukprot:CCA25513.1 AlNc14C303G10405 [Albugo laibachii Nc14]
MHDPSGLTFWNYSLAKKVYPILKVMLADFTLCERTGIDTSHRTARGQEECFTGICVTLKNMQIHTINCDELYSGWTYAGKRVNAYRWTDESFGILVVIMDVPITYRPCTCP